jgi:hypothetical protein
VTSRGQHLFLESAHAVRVKRGRIKELDALISPHRNIVAVDNHSLLTGIE